MLLGRPELLDRGSVPVPAPVTVGDEYTNIRMDD
jgi:hypothetical protein